jgi:multidrug efflux pump subunit AcrA (membrane-fusion protein)
MPDQVEELIREIAVKHGIAVSRDDPIFVLQTINSRLMQDSAKAQQEMLDRYKEELESIAHRWGAEAKSKAEKILNASMTASKEAMLRTMQEGAAVATTSLRKELDAAMVRVDVPLRECRRLTFLNLVASVCMLLGAAAVLWTALSPI